MNYPSCRVWIGMIEEECSYWTPNYKWNGTYYYVESLVCIPVMLEPELIEEWDTFLSGLKKRAEDKRYTN